MFAGSFGFLLFLGFYSGLQCINQPDHISSRTDKTWDYLLFTQHWPPTVCVDWVEKNPSHTCSMPDTPDSWTIHGIWPTKTGHIGPQFCNKTWLFDPEEVRPIENRLEKTWTNIEAGTNLYDLWAHEWNKHGTCAAEIEPFNSQLKYFTRGLDWLESFSMSKILAESGINPSDEKLYTLDQISDAIKVKLNVEPQIECRNEKGGKQYLFELRLCFTKALELIDCNATYNMTESDYRIVTNCMKRNEIIYPATYKPPQKQLLEFYKLMTFLQWYTL